MQLTLAQLTEILETSPIHSSETSDRAIANGVVTDTRSLRPGEIFVALRGERFDGHQFAATAVANGAIAIITDRPLDLNIPQFCVDDTLAAYQKIARWWRDRFSIPIIAITGSVGKTTTKELIAAVLQTRGKVLKTAANYNNEIGVPQTLLQLSSEHDFAVIEMAMRGEGQIALLAQITRPDIAVITNVGTAHIGLLGSEDAIARAKCELLDEMPETAIAILNQDNQRLIDTAATVWSGKTITFGLDGGDMTGELVDARTLKFEGQTYPLPIPGRHNALNYLAALAVAKVLSIDLEPLRQGISVSLPSGRARRYDLPNEIVLLDETYNAGLESMLAAVQMLAETPGQRRIAVLGTMKELGSRSLEFHRQVGEKVKELQLDALYILADRAEAEAISEGAKGLPWIDVADIDIDGSRDALAGRLRAFIQPGDVLLFKASHSVALDRVVERLRSSF